MSAIASTLVGRTLASRRGLPWTSVLNDGGGAGMSEDGARAPSGSRFADQRPYVVVVSSEFDVRSPRPLADASRP